jgi:hypothetical protein
VLDCAVEVPFFETQQPGNFIKFRWGWQEKTKFVTHYATENAE